VRNILHDLYYGCKAGYERRPVRSAENIAINYRIEAEKRYFEEKMPRDDVIRFQALESLYTQAHEFDEIDAYVYGFKLGVMLMFTVFTDENEPMIN